MSDEATPSVSAHELARYALLLAEERRLMAQEIYDFHKPHSVKRLNDGRVSADNTELEAARRKLAHRTADVEVARIGLIDALEDERYGDLSTG